MSSRGVLPELWEDRVNDDPDDREESLGREKPDESLIVYSILWESEGPDLPLSPTDALRDIGHYHSTMFADHYPR